jgi:hypothetical protein
VGAAGKRVNPAEIIKMARAAGNAAGLDPGKAIEGLQAFTATTGDLATGMSVVKDLGILARATGTDFEDMVAAAGEVSAKLGDIPNKGETVIKVMRSLAGQGKLGSIEIKHLAVEMAKMGAGAKRFDMAPDAAIGMMGAIAQTARSSGGAKNASVAVNAAMAFVTGMTKGSTIKNLQDNNIQPFADPGKGPGKNTKLLNPEMMILAILRQSGGSQKMIGQMIKDKMAYTAVAGFADLYNKAGGGDKGLDAVRGEFRKYEKIAMGEGEIKDSHAASMATPEAKMQLFNNRLQEVGEKIMTAVVPALEQLAPTIIKGVEAFGQFVAWAAENPGKALAVALSASIARAGIETVLRSGIESLLMKASGAGGPGGVGGKLGGALGALGAGLTIVATAVAIEQVGELIIDKVLDRKSKAQDASQNAEFKALNAADQARAFLDAATDPSTGTHSVTDKDKAALDAAAADLDLQIRQAKAYENKTKLDVFGIGGVGAGALNYVTGGAVGQSFDSQSSQSADVKNMANLQAALDRLHAQQARMNALLGAPLKVIDVGANAPAASDKGRSGGLGK